MPYLTNLREHCSLSFFDPELQPRYCFDSSRIGDNENRKDTWHSGRTHNDAHNRRVLVDHPIATAALRCQCRFCCCWLREREGGKPHREKARRTDVKKKREREGGVIETDEPPVAVSPVGHSELTTTIVYTSCIPAYNTLNATRDASLTKITLVTNYKLNRDERFFSREFEFTKIYYLTKDYIRCEGGYLSSNRIFFLSFFLYFRSFHNPIPFSFVRQSPGTPRANRQCVYRLGNRAL